MAKSIRIIRNYDDSLPIVLGKIEFPANMTGEQVCDHVEALWEKFQNTEPDSDNDFMEFLGKNGYTVIGDDDLDITVG